MLVSLQLWLNFWNGSASNNAVVIAVFRKVMCIL